MIAAEPHFTLRLARDDRDLRAAQRLRYRVFVEELGGNGDMVDHDQRLEIDSFDQHFDHLVLIDKRRDAVDLDDVVGVYRLLPCERAAAAGGYYSEGEYDVSALKASGRKLLELGRSCVLPDYRGGTAMLHLWNGLADYVNERGIEVLFGTASFHGTDTVALAQPLSYLHQNHLAPEQLRVKARAGAYQRMDLIPADQIDRKAAMLATPALIKAYLRLGGFVGEGAWIDHAFNTIDVCLVMDTGRMSSKHRDYYSRRQGTAE